MTPASYGCDGCDELRSNCSVSRINMLCSPNLLRDFSLYVRLEYRCIFLDVRKLHNTDIKGNGYLLFEYLERILITVYCSNFSGFIQIHARLHQIEYYFRIMRRLELGV